MEMISRSQLLEMVQLSNKKFMKISSTQFTDEVLLHLKENCSGIKGFFLGKNALADPDLFVDFIKSCKDLSWLRLTRDPRPVRQGPPPEAEDNSHEYGNDCTLAITAQHQAEIKEVHPGIKLWIRDLKPEEQIHEHAQLWEMENNDL
jgi:hypothetical protein